jgi:hypothetical protein
MLYALLFYNRPPETLPESEREAILGKGLAEMRDWSEELRRAGVYRTGLRLAPVPAATSLRRKGDDVLVTDGPFAETKEILGGLVVVECADLDEALAWARRCPIVQFGTVEVRPEFGAPR